MTTISTNTCASIGNHCLATNPQRELPTPRVECSAAFVFADELEIEVTTTAVPPPPSAPVAQDPIYIELSNVEPNVTLKLVNLSRKPTASFDNADDIAVVSKTGYLNRRAAFSLTEAQMKAIDLQPGDQIKLLVEDQYGNRSPAVQTRIAHDLSTGTNLDQKTGLTAGDLRQIGFLNRIDAHRTLENMGLDARQINSLQRRALEDGAVNFVHTDRRTITNYIARSYVVNFLSRENPSLPKIVTQDGVDDTRAPVLDDSKKELRVDLATNKIDLTEMLEPNISGRILNVSSGTDIPLIDERFELGQVQVGDVLEINLWDLAQNVLRQSYKVGDTGCLTPFEYTVPEDPVFS